VAYGSRDTADIETDLQQFVFTTAGAFSGFRARDWSDYTAIDEQIGEGDGSTYYFRLTKRYGTYERRIMKPDPTTVTITVNGNTADPDSWAIDADNGVVVFLVAPTSGVITWSGQFHVPVRFEDDQLTTSMLMYSKGAINDIGLREIRVREVIDTDEYDTIRDYLGAFDKTDLIAMFDLLDYHVNTKWYETI